MTTEAAKLITEYGGELRENYSGRGMYGNSTAAVMFDTKAEFYTALADALSDALEGEMRYDADLLLAVLRKHRFDSMGMSVIVY